MKYVVIALMLVTGACAPRQMDDLTYSREMYIGCLRGHEPAECETQRAAFEANRGYADSVSRRMASRPAPVFVPYQAPAPVQPPASQGFSCMKYGIMVNCS